MLPGAFKKKCLLVSVENTVKFADLAKHVKILFISRLVLFLLCTII